MHPSNLNIYWNCTFSWFMFNSMAMAAMQAIGLLFLGSVSSIQQMMFKRTANMTTSSWLAFMTRELVTPTFQLCAVQCLKEKQSCNSWHYDDLARNCQLGNVRICNEFFFLLWIFHLTSEGHFLGRTLCQPFSGGDGRCCCCSNCWHEMQRR